jgi:hypothetical protein
MHYGDPKQLKSEQLEIIVYKHETMKHGVFDYHLTSIKKCRNFDPTTLRFLIEHSNKYFSKVLRKYKKECYYKLCIKTAQGTSKILFTSIINVSNSKNKLNFLH